ncbi:MAG: porin family protein [Bacteroidota bacterium]
MKRFLLIYLISFLSYLSLSAQKNPLFLGVEMGPVWASLEGEPTSFLQAKLFPSTSVRTGLFLQQDINPQLSYKTGIYFTQKGAASIQEPWPQQGATLLLPDISRNFSFFQIPVSIRYHPIQKLGLYASFGGFFSVLFDHAHSAFRNSPRYEEEELTLDIGLHSGIGMQFPLSPKQSVGLELNYEWGLSDISRFGRRPVVERELKTRAINLGVNYFFMWK